MKTEYNFNLCVDENNELHVIKDHHIIEENGIFKFNNGQYVEIFDEEGNYEGDILESKYEEIKILKKYELSLFSYGNSPYFYDILLTNIETNEIIYRRAKEKYDSNDKNPYRLYNFAENDHDFIRIIFNQNKNPKYWSKYLK